MVYDQETTRRVFLRTIQPLEAGNSTPLIARISCDPFYMGGGDTDLLCGNCHWLLAHRVEPSQIPSIVIKCPRCDHHNCTGAELSS